MRVLKNSKYYKANQKSKIKNNYKVYRDNINSENNKYYIGTKNNLNGKPNIYIVDMVMGSGKTSAAIIHINSAPKDENFIFITPYLKEVERIQRSCPTGILRTQKLLKQNFRI